MGDMVITRGLLAIALVACGGKGGTPASAKPTGGVTSSDPACPPEGVIELADGHLRCRELPFELAFPPNTTLQRANEGNMTLFSAKLERGVIALVAEPRTDSPDGPRISELLVNLIKGLAADAVTAPTDAPKLDGAVAAAALTFTTPDGGSGIVRGYFANHWLFAIVVGGRRADTPTRPDQPIAKSFLASLKIRPLPSGTVRFDLSDGGHLEIPASAWSTGPLPASPGVRTEHFMLVPDRGVWFGVRELEAATSCDYIREARDDLDLAERLKSVYANSEYPLHDIARAKSVRDLAVYAQTEADKRNVALYFICSGKSVVQLSVVGERPSPELRPYLDELAKTLVGAR